MTNQRKRHRIKTKASTSRSNCDEFEQYWRECCTFLRRYDRQRRKAQAVLRREKLDACMNQRQLTTYTPYGSLSAYTQYLLHTKCATLRPFIPSVKSLLHLMMVEHSEWVKAWTVRESWWGTYRTQVEQERRYHVSVGDPRAEVNVRIKTVLKADEMLRFAHRMQTRKKRKNAHMHPIGLVYTTANLTGLEQECTVKLKSGSTLQDDSEMIKYFGKDLLISGFLRQFSNDTVYADVETLCLRYYHLHGATHEYSRRYTRNERVRCFKYNSVVEWMGRYGRREAYLCLCPLWDGFDSRDVQLHSLLPLYRVSVERRQDPKRPYYRWDHDQIRKRQPHRYVMRKWSAYHKLNRI